MARKKVLTEAEEMEKQALQTELRRLRNQRYHLKRKQRKASQAGISVPVIGGGTDAAASAHAVAVTEEGGEEMLPDGPEPELEPQGSNGAGDEGDWLEDDAPIPTRGGSPIPILVTPNTALVEVLTNLNTRIKAWGYTDNLDGYVAAFKDEFAAAKLDEGAWEEWTSEKGAWLREGDMILEQIQVFISDGWMCSLSSRAGAMMWRHLTAVV
ncbi:hypothetical protein ONZ51_g12269 [Trametes cubensis]|uniref:Uncharacterized protein n=1 Tax=Trametes cubensis TaxID=1111947 RepID=A0AAD7X524_9APHY|nr:hypothetical protein ONZ51_g12269 [Trametes cubensis]